MFVFALIALDVGASFTYLLKKNIRRAVYWAACAVLTVCVTF